MMQKTIQNQIERKPITNVRLENVIIRFNSDRYATATVLLLDEDGMVVDIKIVDFTLEEMNQWGVDDNYVLDLALQKLEK